MLYINGSGNARASIRDHKRGLYVYMRVFHHRKLEIGD